MTSFTEPGGNSSAGATSICGHLRELELVEAGEPVGKRRSLRLVQRDLQRRQPEQRALEADRRELDRDLVEQLLLVERRDLGRRLARAPCPSASTSPPARSRSRGPRTSPRRSSRRPRRTRRRSRPRRRRAGSGRRRARPRARARRARAGSCSGRGSPRGTSGRTRSCKYLTDGVRARRRAGRSPPAPCTGRSSRGSSPRRRACASAAGSSDGRRGSRRRCMSRICATSCGWMPSMLNETMPARRSAGGP